MEEDFEEVMTIPENSELNLVRRNSDFVENNFVDTPSLLVENKSDLADKADSTFVEHESDNVDNNLDFVEHTSNNLEHNLDFNESDPEFVEHKSGNVEDNSDGVEHNLDVVDNNLDAVEHNLDVVESKSECCDETQSKNVDNYFVDENNGSELVDTLPARSQTMPNISSFVDVHPNRIENSSPKILNSVFEDLEPPRPPQQPVERRFHKNSTSVVSAVNAYSK